MAALLIGKILRLWKGFLVEFIKNLNDFLRKSDSTFRLFNGNLGSSKGTSINYDKQF